MTKKNIKTVTAGELRSNLSQIMNEVYFKEIDVIVTRFDKVKCKISRLEEPVEPARGTK